MFHTLTQQMTAASRAFEEAFARGDVPAMIETYYTRDPTVVGEGVGVFRGRDGVESYFAGAVATFSACRFASLRVERAGDGAIETGTVTLTPKDLDVPQVELAYVVVWIDDPVLGWRACLDYFTPGAIAAHP